MATTTLDMQNRLKLRTRIEHSVAEHRPWYIFQGIVFILAGMFGRRRSRTRHTGGSVSNH